MQPASDCTCKNNIKSSDVKIGVTLAVIVLVPTLLASSYFSGILGISPYKKIRYEPFKYIISLQIYSLCPRFHSYNCFCIQKIVQDILKHGRTLQAATK